MVDIRPVSWACTNGVCDECTGTTSAGVRCTCECHEVSDGD